MPSSGKSSALIVNRSGAVTVKLYLMVLPVGAVLSVVGVSTSISPLHICTSSSPSPVLSSPSFCTCDTVDVPSSDISSVELLMIAVADISGSGKTVTVADTGIPSQKCPGTGSSSTSSPGLSVVYLGVIMIVISTGSLVVLVTVPVSPKSAITSANKSESMNSPLAVPSLINIGLTGSVGVGITISSVRSSSSAMPATPAGMVTEKESTPSDSSITLPSA